MTCGDAIVEDEPALAAAVLVVAAGTYAAISYVMRQTVNSVEVVLFAVAFAAVYVVFSVYSETIEECLGT